MIGSLIKEERLMAEHSRTDMELLRVQLLEIRCFWESASPEEQEEFLGDRDRDQLDRDWFWLWGKVYAELGHDTAADSLTQ